MSADRRRLAAAALACAVAASVTAARSAAIARGVDQAAPGPVATAATNVAPAAVDPAVSAILANVSAAELRATDVRLVGFGTRNLFSETSSTTTRGVYAARAYLADRFRAIARTSGGRMTVAYDTYVQPKTPDIPRAVEVSSVIATLRGDDPARGIYVISSHYDSRDSDGNDPTRDAPGADDNGSGTSAVVEAARVMAAAHFRGTIVFACFDGEEQGLFGSDHFAKTLAARGVAVGANLNNDIIGASVGHGGESEPNVVRIFSEALPAGSVPRRIDVLGTENDSPSRELARFAARLGTAYVPAMQPALVFRADRFLRGGDQESFASQGFPAIRYVEPNENFDHQHQDVRVENGVTYGDELAYVDFSYLARVTQLNVAALATLALAPPRPIVRMLTKTLGYDTTLTWAPIPGASRYEVVWRTTTDATWTNARDVGSQTSATLPLSKDDYLFGVRAIDAAGHESDAGFPTPLR